MRISLLILRIMFAGCLLLLAGCSGQKSPSSFLQAFTPGTMLAGIGKPADILYSEMPATNSPAAPSIATESLHREWLFSTTNAAEQLKTTLSQFQTEVENLLTAKGSKITSRGLSIGGDTPGFTFNYTTDSGRGIVRVIGMALVSGRHVVNVFVYEY
jgi:hypothetical protein